ncbi:serologically defined colon cancer antigen 8 isoform 2-T2 [Guaruba guarouba]
MRAPREEPALEESLERYQRRLQDRASESIHQLKYALEDRQFGKDEGEVGFDQSSVDKGSGDVDMSNDDSENPAWQKLQQSHAVNQLKILLEHQERMESEDSLSRRKRSFCKPPEAATGDLPALSDLVPIINDQSQYINHLEAEVKFCKEELSGMKSRVQVVVLENEELHQKLKFLTTEHKLREQTLLGALANAENSWTVGGNDCSTLQPVTSSPAHNADQVFATSAAGEIEKWHVELDKLKHLHQEKVNILEAQIQSLRKDLSESQKTCKDLEGRLKHQQSLVSAANSNWVGGLCPKCAQHEAVIAETHSNIHMQTIERVTKERDDLMDAFVSLRQNMKEMQQRESNACEQVKYAVQMAEEANLVKTKALVQCEQLKSKMERQKNRLERELAAQLNKMAEEKATLWEEMKKEKEDLSAMVTAMSENVAMLEAKVERITREKNSLANQLEESQHQLVSHETEMDKQIEKLELELNGNKQRLEQAQQDVAGAREECLKLTEMLSKSEHQLHLTRLKKESIEQSISNEAKARALQAQQREQELTQKMQQMEAQHEKTVNELDSLLTSQNAFIAKLKEEYCMLARKLEQMSEKYRSEVNQLSQEKEYLHGRLKKMQKRNDELDQQCIQHGRMHERMKSRLQQLDKHCQATAQQLVELLNKQNQLFKEKQLLTEEVQFLRTQGKKWDADLKQDTDGIE